MVLPFCYFVTKQNNMNQISRFADVVALILLSLATIPLEAYDLPTLPPMPFIPASLPPNTVPMGNPTNFMEKKMDFAIETNGPFLPTWTSISNNLPADVAALRQGKFGIWVHYGPQASGVSGDWYAQHLYQQDSLAYSNHMAMFGHPSTNGYKEVVRMWNPTNYNPAALAQIYYNAGARFVLVQGVHHDNFDNWNSKYNPWNIMNFGAKRDTMAEWVSAARSLGMHIGVAFHHEYSWWFYAPAYGSDSTGAFAGVSYDALTATNRTGTWWQNYDLRRLYNINLNEYQEVKNPYLSGGWSPAQGIFTNHLDYSHWYATQWALRILDVIENYDPDFIYTDGDSTQPFSGYATGTGYKCDAMERVIAHLENRAIERHGKADVFSVVKFHPGDRVVTTFEGNYPSGIKTDQPWMADTPVGDWFYKAGFTYNSDMVIRELLECVSRDGAACICISLQPDGSLDSGSKSMLQKVGQWMTNNSEGIYGSHAWVQYGEGLRTLPPGKLDAEQANYVFTTNDFRFTVSSNGFLYAYCMTVPSKNSTIKILSLGSKSGALTQPINSVTLLGSSKQLSWTQQSDGLVITCPEDMPFTTAVGFKIGMPGGVESLDDPADRNKDSLAERASHNFSDMGSWIWDTNTFDRQTVRFWKTFEIPSAATVTLARLRITVDNGYIVYLDGRELVRDAEWRHLYEYDITPLLKPGKHVLAVEAYNSTREAGFVFGLQIGLASGQVVRVKSDASWRIVPNDGLGWENKVDSSESWHEATVKCEFGSGPWPAQDTVDLVPPFQPINIPFWKSGWFVVLLILVCISLGLFGLILVFRLLLHQKEKQLLRRERTRIARDIHDDLGTRATQLALQGEVALNILPINSDLHSQIARIAGNARALVRAMDEVLWAINPRRDTLQEFATFVCSHAQAFFKNSPTQCLLEVEPGLSNVAFDLPYRRNLLFAIKEVLNNVAKHSQATELILEIRRQGNGLTVVVQDNGRGFDPSKIKLDRNGLENINQRMSEAGGSCSLTSQPGKGCRVELHIPSIELQRRSWLSWGVRNHMIKIRPISENIKE